MRSMRSCVHHVAMWFMPYVLDALGISKSIIASTGGQKHGQFVCKAAGLDWSIDCGTYSYYSPPTDHVKVGSY